LDNSSATDKICYGIVPLGELQQLLLRIRKPAFGGDAGDGDGVDIDTGGRRQADRRRVPTAPRSSMKVRKQNRRPKPPPLL
jgi:hypothetical protein